MLSWEKMYKNIQVIAEVKTASPFGFKSPLSWDELFAVANEIGDMISVHTDSRWGGSLDLVSRARSLTAKPILAKGIHTTDAEVEEAIGAGANFVLVVGRIPAVREDRCLIEPLTLEELRTIPEDLRAVWNSRDLATGGMKTETFEQARELFPGWLCQASNIRTIKDIKDSADAVLIGTNVLDFAVSLRTYNEGN